MSKFKDLTGNKYGRLTVLHRVDGARDKRGRSIVLWECSCVCGNSSQVTTGNLTSGRTKSCGCLNSELVIERNFKHGKRNTRLYTIWAGMKGRCNNPNDDAYDNYGGRGIKVCDDWLDDFETFYKWAKSSGYKNSLTIDRIDNDGNYEPHNCRWVTMEVQARNRRNKGAGENITTGEPSQCTRIAREAGLPYNVVWKRLKLGWTESKIKNTPVKKLARN